MPDMPTFKIEYELETPYYALFFWCFGKLFFWGRIELGADLSA